MYNRYSGMVASANKHVVRIIASTVFRKWPKQMKEIPTAEQLSEPPEKNKLMYREPRGSTRLWKSFADLCHQIVHLVTSFSASIRQSCRSPQEFQRYC